jgi:hypothetical protein
MTPIFSYHHMTTLKYSVNIAKVAVQSHQTEQLTRLTITQLLNTERRSLKARVSRRCTACSRLHRETSGISDRHRSSTIGIRSGKPGSSL